MLLSAASLVLVVVVTSGSDTDLNEREMKAWKKIQPSVVFLMEGQRVRGSAALISREGYFITHATALSGKTVEGRKSDGSAVKLKWLSLDDPTQFVLLKAEEWDETVAPLTVAEAASDTASKNLLAITTTGPIRAERSKDGFGIFNPSKRVVPVSEILLENNLPTLGGSLLFDLNGQLAGALNASLGMSRDQQTRAGNTRGGAGPGGGGFGGGTGDLLPKATTNSQYGPGILTAAYTIGPKVMKRVVAGFLSDDRAVKHPAIGVFCRDAVPQGALIDSVTEGSPADKAGLMKGDVILTMNNQGVKTLIDFSRIISNQEVGDTMKIWIRRGSLNQMITVTVGGSQD